MNHGSKVYAAVTRLSGMRLPEEVKGLAIFVFSIYGLACHTKSGPG